MAVDLLQLEEMELFIYLKANALKVFHDFFLEKVILYGEVAIKSSREVDWQNYLVVSYVESMTWSLAPQNRCAGP